MTSRPNYCVCCQNNATHRGADGFFRCDLHRLNADIAPFDTSTVDALRAELAAMRAERDALKARLAEAGDKVQEMCERIGRIHIADYATESVELCEGLYRIRAVLLDSRDMDALKAKLADLKAREAKLREAVEIVARASFSTLPHGWFTLSIRSDDYAKIRAALAQGGGV